MRTFALALALVGLFAPSVARADAALEPPAPIPAPAPVAADGASDGRWHPSSVDIAAEGGLAIGEFGGQDFIAAEIAAMARVGIAAFGIAVSNSGGVFGANSTGTTALGGVRVPLGRWFVASALGEIGAHTRHIGGFDDFTPHDETA
jgi:hypothetical protein